VSVDTPRDEGLLASANLARALSGFELPVNETAEHMVTCVCACVCVWLW
jgi:hypothetical protein